MRLAEALRADGFRMGSGFADVAAVWTSGGFAFSGVLAEPERFSWAEVGLVVALALVSGALFLYRLEPILGRILRSRRDADFSIRPVGRRVGDFVWEVCARAR